MSLVSALLFFCSRAISSEMSTAESSCTKRNSSIFASRSEMDCSNSRKVVFKGPGHDEREEVLILSHCPACVRSRCSGVSVFHRHRIEAAPQIPGGDRTPRRPVYGKLEHPLARDALAVEVMQADGPFRPRSSSGSTSGRSRLNIRNI